MQQLTQEQLAKLEKIINETPLERTLVGTFKPLKLVQIDREVVEKFCTDSTISKLFAECPLPKLNTSYDDEDYSLCMMIQNVDDDQSDEERVKYIADRLNFLDAYGYLHIGNLTKGIGKVFTEDGTKVFTFPRLNGKYYKEAHGRQLPPAEATEILYQESLTNN